MPTTPRVTPEIFGALARVSKDTWMEGRPASRPPAVSFHGYYLAYCCSPPQDEREAAL